MKKERLEGSFGHYWKANNMALSQLRPMVIEGDRPNPNPQSDFTKLPDGSLIMSGAPKPTEQPPGFFAGLRQWAKEKLNPAPAQPAPFWIPQTPAPVAAAPVAAPVSTVDPGAALPAYNDAAWNEIAGKTAERERVARELGEVSKRVMESPQLIEGKWWK